MRQVKTGKTKGLYHIALIIVILAALNWALILLAGINLMAKIQQVAAVPLNVIAIMVVVSCVLVLWSNWAD